DRTEAGDEQRGGAVRLWAALRRRGGGAEPESAEHAGGSATANGRAPGAARPRISVADDGAPRERGEGAAGAVVAGEGGAGDGGTRAAGARGAARPVRLRGDRH